MHYLVGETINKAAQYEERMALPVCIQQSELFSDHFTCRFFTFCFVQLPVITVVFVEQMIEGESPQQTQRLMSHCIRCLLGDKKEIQCFDSLKGEITHDLSSIIPSPTTKCTGL